MPRHRIESMPRHRAQRPAGTPDRRVGMLVAPRPRSPGHARSASGFAWAGPLGASASRQLAALGARLRRDRRRMMTGAARGLLVSPWFAAGAGFVIATTAFIVAPRAEQRIPGNNSAINVTQCTQRGCQKTVSQGAVPLTEPSDQMKINTAPPAPAAQTVSYHVFWQYGGSFIIEITLTSKQATGDWRLAFAIPGAVITSVVGADWQRSGADSGTARASSGGFTPAASDSSSASQGSGGFLGGSGQRDIKLVVTGHGSDAKPGGCVFDGAQCQFSPSS